MLQVSEPTLLDKIRAREAVVGVLGLGYVGLPLALTFGEGGFPGRKAQLAKPRIGRLWWGQLRSGQLRSGEVQ